jgi:hypothetical protein
MFIDVEKIYSYNNTDFALKASCGQKIRLSMIDLFDVKICDEKFISMSDLHESIHTEFFG